MKQLFKLNGITIALFLLLAYAALPVASSYDQFFLYISIPGSAFFSYISIKDKSLSKYMKLLLLLFIWIFITSFFSYNFNVSSIWLRRLLAVYLLCFSIHQIAKYDYYIPWIYLIWVVSLVSYVFYAQTQINVNQIDYTTNRMTDSNLNANTLGYYTFFSTYIIFYWGILPGKLKKLRMLFFWLMIPLTFYIALITASRQILLIQVPLISILLYIRYFNKTSMVKRFLFIFFVLILMSYIDEIREVFESSFLYQRFQIGIEEEVRTSLMHDGLKTGIDNFITGVGIGCFGFYNYGHDTFSHNSFIELFATTGFIGFLLYLYILFSFIFTQFRRYKKYRNSNYLLFLCVGVFYILYNMLYVFYTDPWLMAFFILLTSHAEIIYKKEAGQIYFRNSVK